MNSNDWNRCSTFCTKIILGCFLLFSCHQNESEKVFQYLPADRTGIDFTNTVTENDSVNILTYEYLYNGGGVAAGDLNNDGRTDLFFTSNQGDNKVYLNQGDFRFEDVTDRSGIIEAEPRWSTGVTIVDINHDGWMDIYVSNSGPGTPESRANYLYINQGEQPDGSVKFVEQATEWGLDAPGTYTTNTTFFDYDLDGDLDAFLLNHANMFYNPLFNSANLRASRHKYFGNKLLRNDDGRFVEVSEEAGILGSGLNFGLSVSITDINDDGFPDIYVTNDYDEQDFLYINNGDGTFSQELNQMMSHISKFGMGSDIADVNNDGLQDVVVLDMLPEDNRRQKLLKGSDDYEKYSKLVDSGYHQQYMRNSLQLNLGRRESDSLYQFSEIGQLAGISNTDWSWGPLVADFDQDGWPDIYITNGYLRDFTNLDFVKYIYPDAVEAARKSDTDLNTWEVVQQMPQTKIPNYMYANDRGYTFRDVTSTWGLEKPSISNGAVYADLDQDGDLDLVVNNINEQAFVIQNKTMPDSAHYIAFQVRLDSGNRYGIGSKVKIYTGQDIQYRELYTSRGFQSSVPPVVHFGLGPVSVVDSVHIVSPYGAKWTAKNIHADSTYTIYIDGKNGADGDDLPLVAQKTSRNTLQFKEYPYSEAGVKIHSREPDYNDFKVQGLLPFQVSKIGPQIVVGDVNKDGLEDFYVTGTSEASGTLAVQQRDGSFRFSSTAQTTDELRIYESGAGFTDFTGDGMDDLLILGGSAVYPAGSPRYRDRLLVNDGTGRLSELENVFSGEMTASRGIAIADYDQDGRLDMFIGGGPVPQEYPGQRSSHLWKNTGSDQQVTFESVDSAVINRVTGHVNDAVWVDYDGDGWLDLFIIGGFMPVRVFRNGQGELVEVTDEAGLSQSNGLWKSITPADLDGDGDVDFVLGNFGVNTQLRATSEEPMRMYYDDFDQNGSVDPILAYYIHGKEYPFPSRDQLLGQLSVLAKKYTSYQSYAEATMPDILDALGNPPEMGKLEVFELRSCWLENDNGRFVMHPLPAAAQFSVLNASVVYDFDQDGHLDILAGGNFYPMSHHLGQMDANKGVILFGDGQGNFKPEFSLDYGLDLSGDLRSMKRIRIGDEDGIVVGYSNGEVRIFSF